MNKIITTKHICNNGVLNLHYNLLPQFSGCATITQIDIYEFDSSSGTYSNALATYSIGNQDPEFAISGGAGEIIYKSADTGNNLIKCKFTINGQGCSNPPCCIDQDGLNWIETFYYVDMAEYERKMLESINLQCDSCDVPMTVVNDLLKLYTIKAAAESDSPMLEMLFSKIACKGSAATTIAPHSSNCHCNG